MERLKNWGLKKSLFLLNFCCILLSLLLIAAVWAVCDKIRSGFPSGGVAFSPDGTMTYLSQPTPEQERVNVILGRIQTLSSIVIPICGMAAAGALFYRLKCKRPINILREGTRRIREQDLDFTIPAVSDDELGQLCAAFETMRAELLQSNRELWRQAEERKRLNAAFAHDLRNPVTVLKGTVKLLRQGTDDKQALERLESYTLRIEQYVEAMSGIQKLELMPVRKKEISCSVLRGELEDTAKLIAPALALSVTAVEASAEIDHGLFLTVAENLIGNAARFADSGISVRLYMQDTVLALSVTDDGPGYPAALLQDGPKPFGKMKEDAAHFGMGLYVCQTLCGKHGGTLRLENAEGRGARATAFFQITGKP